MVLTKSIILGLLAFLFDTCYANEQFICKSNSKIDVIKKCNGIDDCGDNSDERFEVCSDQKCDKQFRCNYGGCIDLNKRCDNKKDCWDNSDESQYECAKGEDLEKLMSNLYGDCGDQYALSCKKKDNQNICLPWSKVCDGEIHCPSGEDEEMALCSALPCLNNGFRCSYGACINSERVCDHFADCYDASDELDEICISMKPWVPHGQSNPTIPNNVILKSAYEQETTWRKSFCKVEDPTGALIAEDYFTQNTYKSGAVAKKGIVALSCKEGYEVHGHPYLMCDGKEWNSDLPKCVRTCKLRHDMHLKKNCSYDDSPFDCYNSPAWNGTLMDVCCAPGYESTNGIQSGTLNCNDQGKWSIYKEKYLPSCVPKCGYIWDEQNTWPWIGSLFQRGMKPDFKFRSFVTILSPYIAITPSNVFKTTTIAGVNPDEPLLLAIAEGHKTEKFSSIDDHGYKLHNICDVNIIKSSDNKELAVITVIQPFQIGPNLQPICVNYNARQTVQMIQKHEVGYPAVEKASNNRYFLVGIVADGKETYDIRKFETDLRAFTDKYQPPSVTY